MDDLERWYLRAAYEVAMKDPRRAFYQDEIAADFDLDYGPNSDEDLVGRGYIETDKQNQNLGRVALRLTTAGKEEAERLGDPIEQRKELRRDFLRVVYERADGNPTRFVDWRELAPGYGLADTMTPPNSIMGAIEQLARSGFITIEVEEATSYRITAKGVDEVE